MTAKSTAKLPSTAPAATRKGSPAATSPPKTSTSSTIVSGTAMLSAFARSAVIVSLIALLIAGAPRRARRGSPAAPPSPSVGRRQVLREVALLDVCRVGPGEDEHLPGAPVAAREASGACPEVQYETTCVTPGSARRPADERGGRRGVGVEPVGVTTASAATGSATPNWSRSWAAALAESLPGSSKPAACSLLNTPEPSAPATTRPRTNRTSVAPPIGGRRGGRGARTWRESSVRGVVEERCDLNTVLAATLTQ